MDNVILVSWAAESANQTIIEHWIKILTRPISSPNQSVSSKSKLSREAGG
jgi:hypothetical protein